MFFRSGESNDRYASLLREQQDAVTRIWADEVYASDETGLADRLSYRQLIDHLPNLLDELGRLLDAESDAAGIAEAARRARYFIHVRFQQHCLIDEVARELSVLREIVNDFLWRESFAATERDWRDLRAALKRANTFFDELIRQMIVVYSASLRPPVPTYASIWHPSRRPRRRGVDHTPPHTAREE